MNGRVKRRRRAVRVTLVVLAVAAVGLTIAAAAGLGLTSSDPKAQADSSLSPATATVTKQTLVETQSESGEVGHGTTVTVKSRLSGTLTSLPPVGTTITRGQGLYKVDNKPVVLLYGSLPAYRALASGDAGQDVRQLERNLWALGYRGFTADRTYTASTASAVRTWQDDLGLSQSGAVDLGRVVYATGPVRIDTHGAALGDPLQRGGDVLDYSGTTKLITVDLDIEDQRLAKKGAAVTVKPPNSETVGGKITSAATVIVTSSSASASSGSTTETKARVIIAVKEQGALAQMDSATVEVAFTASKVDNVLTVPVAALLALAEGGYGVQVVNGSSSEIIPVQTGLFAGGRVEVSGAGLAEGLTVGVPE